jgi:hypothetical protein
MHNQRREIEIKPAVGVAAVVAFVVLFLVSLGWMLGAVTEDEPAKEKAHVPVPASIAVDGPDKNVTPDTVLPLDVEARNLIRRAAKAPEKFDIAGGLRGDDSTPVAVHEGPLATPNFPGCTTRILPTNWSNRNGTVKAVGLHYTAGGNIAGLSDMNGLTGFASSPSAGVSWHFLIDAEGHCYYSVPLNKKAWTIGNLNSETVNIEVIGRGNEPSYPASKAGLNKLASVVRRLAQIYNFPVRVGAVQSCRVTRSGVITHWQGGGCAGGHVDIKPYDLVKVVNAIGTTTTCNLDCQRRKRHTSAHAEINRRGCAPIDKTRSDRCIFLHRRLNALHKAGVKF